MVPSRLFADRIGFEGLAVATRGADDGALSNVR
jgi:hypothetical protein